MRYVTFCVWLFLLALMFLRFIQKRYIMYQYFISFYGSIIFHCMNISPFVYPFTCWWLFGLFHFLAIVNSAAMDMWVHIFVWVPVFSSLGYISRGRIVGSYGKFMFNIVRNCQTGFHRGCTIFYSHQQYIKVSTFPHFF